MCTHSSSFKAFLSAREREREREREKERKLMESSSRGREEFRESGIFRRSVPIKISPEHRLLVSITTGDEDICVLMAGLIEMWLTGKEREREIALR